MSGSTVQSDSSQMCGCGTSVGPAGTVHWGGGLYINISQADLPDAAEGAVAPTKTGITYSLHSASGLLPTNTRIQVCTVPMTPTGAGCPAADNYCYTLTSLSGTIPWSYFNTTCWSPTSTGYLSATPASISQIQLEVASSGTTTSTSWDLCVGTLSF
jgi:hypothetical protein